MRRRAISVAAVSCATAGRPGSWWLDGVEQETFTRKGLYIVRLALAADETGEEKLEQVGAWRAKGADCNSSCLRVC